MNVLEAQLKEARRRKRKEQYQDIKMVRDELWTYLLSRDKMIKTNASKWQQTNKKENMLFACFVQISFARVGISDECNYLWYCCLLFVSLANKNTNSEQMGAIINDARAW